jgi:hypothetical protein
MFEAKWTDAMLFVFQVEYLFITVSTMAPFGYGLLNRNDDTILVSLSGERGRSRRFDRVLEVW